MPVVPPRPKGPSLNALRAFEASARLNGFSAAAEELSVTPGAIAQQIKNLEDWIGAPLFSRAAQGVALTPLGEAVFPEFKSAFDRLGDAVLSLRARAGASSVAIAALPSIAQCWLMPRLSAITPEGVTVSVTALEEPPDLARSGFDIALFFEADDAREGGVKLSGDSLYPVCTPDLARRLTRVEDLAAIPCLSDDHWRADWRTWLDAVTPDRSIAVSGPRYSLFRMALDAAKAGAGVLIGHDPLVDLLVARGELVCPFSARVPLKRNLILRQVAPAGPAVDAVVARLRDAP